MNTNARSISTSPLEGEVVALQARPMGGGVRGGPPSVSPLTRRSTFPLKGGRALFLEVCA